MREAYSNYSDLVKFFNDKRKECPKGVSLKRNVKSSGTYLSLQFILPESGKRSARPCNSEFTFSGIEQAAKKAHKVAEALLTFKKSSEFWEWYDKVILEVNVIINDYKTYREIFTKIETKFWNSLNKNTKRKRSKDIPNDVKTFSEYYGIVFNKFSNWDNHPNFEDFKKVLSHWKQGTKKYKDCLVILKAIAKLSHNNDNLLSELDDIDGKQTEFKEKQSISLEDFLTWHKQALENSNSQYQENRESWLWVASMCVIYGLRPSEIAAAKNLTQSVTLDGVKIPALDDPTNKDLLLYIDDFTYFGVSVKTGKRVCKPMTNDKELIEYLGIKRPKLPIYTPKPNSNAKSKCEGFSNRLMNNLINWKCPVTQMYAFRHLANQLGEQYGIPQEIRARMLGHTVAVNESTYKKRSNIKTSIDLLTKHSKEPLSLETAKHELKNYGFSLEDDSVKAILRIIYQIDSQKFNFA